MESVDVDFKKLSKLELLDLRGKYTLIHRLHRKLRSRAKKIIEAINKELEAR